MSAISGAVENLSSNSEFTSALSAELSRLSQQEDGARSVPNNLGGCQFEDKPGPRKPARHAHGDSVIPSIPIGLTHGDDFIPSNPAGQGFGDSSVPNSLHHDSITANSMTSTTGTAPQPGNMHTRTKRSREDDPADQNPEPATAHVGPHVTAHKGAPVTLSGQEANLDDPAPDFETHRPAKKRCTGIDQSPWGAMMNLESSSKEVRDYDVASEDVTNMTTAHAGVLLNPTSGMLQFIISIGHYHTFPLG